MKNNKTWGESAFIIGFALLVLGACSIGLFPSKDPWYAQHYIIMQDFEWDTYKELFPSAKTQFQELFWKVRHPQAQEIFSSRLKIATESFKKESSSNPWNTDRGRILLLHGSPAEVRYSENTNLGGKTYTSGVQERIEANVDRSSEDISARQSEVWVYPYRSVIIRYQFDFVQPRQWKLSVNMYESAFREEFESQSRNVTYEIMDVEEYKEKLEELKKIKE
ncbi:MAG: GWxTD domain-containing protein [Candidatus Aminicenantes bacterium]|nr:GWxTD domain-containing protein [Candidatus Aminicenantes bacterium]